MPRLTTVETNFTGGEISPRIIGRIDLPLYQNSAKIIENALPLIHGGVRRRDGTAFVAETKTSATAARIIPFIFSTTEAYVLELGDLYVRVYKDGSRIENPPGTPYEIVSPFSAAQLFDVRYVQSADTMFLVHPSFTPYQLKRYSDLNWILNVAPFDPLPFDEIGASFATSLTLSLATVGVGRTATASAPTFQNSDVGRSIYYLGGVFLITAFTSNLLVTGTIQAAFGGTAIPVSVWTLGGSPQETITPSAKDPVETTITLTATVLNTWRSTDVGGYVRINGGLCKITVFTSSLIVSAVIKEVLTSVVGAPANSWSLEFAVWSAANGYPTACAFYQQRLILANTTAFPQTVWGSTSGAYLDFTLGIFDDDAFSYTIASDQINPILHLSTSKVLIALTYGGEFIIKGGVEKALTPTNVQVDAQSTYGCSKVRPVRAGNQTVFMQRSGLKVRAMDYDVNTDAYVAPDLSVFAEHITGVGINDMAYVQEPDPFVWAVRSDGQIAACALSASEDVAAWCRQITDGVVESVCVIPYGGTDQSWLLIRRTINAVTKRYVERFSTSFITDCSLFLSNFPTALTVWTGLGHLEGKSVAAYSGTFLGNYTVTGGQITIAKAVNILNIGLPYTSTVDLLEPEPGTGTGAAQGNAMRTSEISVRVLNTQSLSANGTVIPFRAFGSSLLDDPLPIFTGLKRLETLGWERGSSQLTFTSSDPFPFHMLSVIRKFTVND